MNSAMNSSQADTLGSCQDIDIIYDKIEDKLTEIEAFPGTQLRQDAQTVIEHDNDATASNARAEAARDCAAMIPSQADRSNICQGVEPIYAEIGQEMSEIQTIPRNDKLQDASTQTLIGNENDATTSNARAESARDCAAKIPSQEDSLNNSQDIDTIYAKIGQEVSDLETNQTEDNMKDASNQTLSDIALSIPPRGNNQGMARDVTEITKTEAAATAADNYTGPVLRPRKQTTTKPSISRPGPLSDLSPQRPCLKICQGDRRRLVAAPKGCASHQ